MATRARARRSSPAEVDHETLVDDIVSGLLGRSRDIQDEITRARCALAEADSALLDVLAAMGIPSRPLPASHLRHSGTR